MKEDGSESVWWRGAIGCGAMSEGSRSRRDWCLFLIEGGVDDGRVRTNQCMGEQSRQTNRQIG